MVARNRPAKLHVPMVSMKLPCFRLFYPATACLLGGLLAPQVGYAQTIAAPRSADPAVEWRAEYAFSDRADIAEGSRPLGEIRHQYYSLAGTRAFALDAASAVIVGGSWRQFDFSGSEADVPGRLGALALKLGYTRTLSAQWSLRAEIDPGLYSDFEDLSGDDVNVPFGMRLLYAASRELQWGFALFVDPRSSQPVIGGVGARWLFAPGWTLMAFLPEPKVEFAVSPTVSLYAGAGLRGGTFRVAEDFGRKRGRAALDNQDVDFREITAGVGARWKASPTLSVQAGVGWMIDRRFEYEERNLLLNGDGAPTFSLSVSGAF